MTGLLLVILFLLNLIIIFAVVLLYVRQNRLVELEKQQRQIREESEEVLAAFLLELKEENEQFYSKLNALNHINKDIDEGRQESSRQKETQTIDTDELNTQNAQTSPIITDTYRHAQAMKVYDQAANHEQPSQQTEEQELEHLSDLSQQTFTDRVFDLNKKGVSAEEIAKMLKTGKTEVDLVLKFQNHEK